MLFVEWLRVKRPLPVYWLANYHYCPAKVKNILEMGPSESEVLEVGKLVHEEELVPVAEEFVRAVGPIQYASPLAMTVDQVLSGLAGVVRRALRKRAVIANTEEETLLWLMEPELGIIGIPDMVDCSNGREPVVVELKSTGRIPRRPWSDHVVQVGAYTLCLRAMGFGNARVAQIRYVERGGRGAHTFTILVDETVEHIVRATVRSLRALLEGRARWCGTDNPRKCLVCDYRHVCPFSLARGRNVN